MNIYFEMIQQKVEALCCFKYLNVCQQQNIFNHEIKKKRGKLGWSGKYRALTQLKTVENVTATVSNLRVKVPHIDPPQRRALPCSCSQPTWWRSSRRFHPPPPQKQDSATLDMERCNKEIDMLRKQCEAISQELKEALQEAEVAKCRRDWAFQERDKIVAERESIR